MAIVSINIQGATADEILHELCKFMTENQQQRNTTSSTTDHRYMHSRELTKVHDDAFAKGYAEGLRDAKAEAQQEKIMSGNNKLHMMLEYDVVMLCPEPGRAPFKFAPYGILRHVDTYLPDEDQRIPPHAVGILGTNLVTMERVFYVRVDHWTLCPKSDAP